MALQCKGLKYIEKRMYFSLPSQDKCLEFMILENLRLRAHIQKDRGLYNFKDLSVIKYYFG